MTYRELARLAGVSYSTVSKAMAGSDEISEETAKRIRDLAMENGIRRPAYHRNHSTLSVAIFVPEIISVFYSQIVTSIINILLQSKIEPVIHVCGFAKEKYYKAIDHLKETNAVDGIIFLSLFDSYPHDFYPLEIEIPQLFLLEADSPSENFLSNGLKKGIQQAVEYLVSQGHREIGFIGEKNTLGKELRFHEVMQSMKLPESPQYIFTSDKRFEEIGYEAAKYFISRKKLPTAFLAAYDEVAIGVIHAFAEAGIRVPEDVSIIGINDIPGAAYASVPLTTIKMYNEELLSVALKLFIDNINDGEEHPPLDFAWQCQLIVRKSTAKPREWEVSFD